MDVATDHGRYEQGRIHPMKQVLCRVNEAAAALGLGRTKTYELIGRGSIRSVRIDNAVRVPVSAIEEFLRDPRIGNMGVNSRLKWRRTAVPGGPSRSSSSTQDTWRCRHEQYHWILHFGSRGSAAESRRQRGESGRVR